MIENKKTILEKLTEALVETRNLCDIVQVELIDNEETVVVRFENGYERRINVACDSGLAMIYDVVKALR